MNFTLQNFAADGGIKTSVSSIPAAGITGQVSPSQGGTGQNWGASSGIPKLTAGTASLVTAPSGALVGDTDSQTLTNKSLQDSTTSIVDNSDPTKKLQFQVSPITAGQTRVLTVVDRDDTIATLGGNEVFTGAKDYNGATMREPVSAGGALTSTEGYVEWDSTNKLEKIYDGTRERGKSGWGFQPTVYLPGWNPGNAYSSTVALAAVSGTIITPVMISGHFNLLQVRLLNNDTTLARSWRWDLYVDRDDASNTVNRVATSNGSDAFTAAAASIRTLGVTGGNVYIPPGCYWLAIQNNHASNTLGIGITGLAGGFTLTTIRSKITGGTNGSTLDIVAATWSATNQAIAFALQGDYAASGAIF